MSYKYKNYSKFVATAATATLVASAVAPAASAAFSDVADRYKDAVDYLAAEGVTQGYPGGKFGTDDNIKRQDAAVMIARVLGATPEGNYPDAGFTDVPTNRQWAVNFLAEKKIVSGKAAGKFGANDFTQRDEMAKIIAGAYELVADETNAFPFTDVSKTFKTFVDALNEAGIAQGYANSTQFGSGDMVTRGQFALFIYRAEGSPVATPVVTEITAASAASNKTVELSGTALENLSKEDLSIEGNTVESVTFDKESEKVLVTFKNAFVSGQEQTLVFTDAEKVKTTFTFTYTFEVNSVETTTVRVDDNTDAQFLGFTVNGKSVSVQSLLDAGFTVEFQSTTASVLKNSKTGELDESALPAEFSYKVVISKGDVKVESELSKVKVFDFATYLTNLSDVTVNQGDVKVTSGKVSVQDGAVNVLATKATTLNGATVTPSTVTYKSSNPAVASVNATTGVVTPIQAGTVTITASADEASISVPLTVVSGARTAASTTATTTEVKLLATKSQAIDFKAVDQYGDEFEGTLSVVSRDAAIADGSSTITFVNGASSETVNALTKGSTIIDLKNGATVIQSINVSVSDDAVVASRKVETVSPSADTTLDVVSGSTDQKVELVWNQYNAAGFFIGAETNFTNDDVEGTKYTVSSSDAEVATVAVAADGKITVSAIKEGTANIVIKEGSVTRATAKVTVNNSTPTISAVDFETVEDVTTVGALNKQILTSEGITLSSTDYTAEIDSATGTIFVDVEGTTAGLDAEDIKLGMLKAIYSGKASDIKALDITAGSVTADNVVVGAEGTIVATVTLDGELLPFATKVINVNVPK